MTVLSKIRAAAAQLSCLWPSEQSENEGGFVQKVHIYDCEPGSNKFKRGTVKIDTGNDGPSLVSEETMRAVNGEPRGPGITIRAFNGSETVTGGEVELDFSGPRVRKGAGSRYYTEKFHIVPYIAGGFDMVLNHDFVIMYWGSPSALMIRSGKKKETEGKTTQPWL